MTKIQCNIKGSGTLENKRQIYFLSEGKTFNGVLPSNLEELHLRARCCISVIFLRKVFLIRMLKTTQIIETSSTNVRSTDNYPFLSYGKPYHKESELLFFLFRAKILSYVSYMQCKSLQKHELRICFRNVQ